MHHADAFDRINGLDGATRKLFSDYTKVEMLPSALLLQKVLLALELRWRSEETVLISSLRGTQGVMQGGSEDAGRELTALRSLADLALNKDPAVDFQRVLLSAIETLATLRSERVNWALTRAERAAMVDAHALGREMDRLLETWRCELRVNGDLEDEAQDVVAFTLN